jgi:hypothetical protein
MDEVTEALVARLGDADVPGEVIPALGAFSCDFSLDFTQVTEPLGGALERDRVLMQRFAAEFTWPNDPGMFQKHIPLLQTSPTTALAGGRYLFQGRVQAAEYEQFVTEDFMYPDGVQFLDRPEFADAECRDWTVLGARRFTPLDTHTALRTERFDTGRTNLGQEVKLARALRDRLPALAAEAEARGYGELHLLHNLDDHKVQLVYFHPRVLPVDPTQPDVAAFGALVGAPVLDDALESDLSLTRVFDLTHFVLHVWLFYVTGDSGDAALWPNSPPFPEPLCGDAVCVPSRGEDGMSCAADCVATCGDAECDAGESISSCPSDCEVPLLP